MLLPIIIQQVRVCLSITYRMNQRPIDASATPASTMMMCSDGGGPGFASSGLGAVLVRVGSQPSRTNMMRQKPRNARGTVN